MQAILMLVRQLNDGRAEVEERVHPPSARGQTSKGTLCDVFELRRSFECGPGAEVPYSALKDQARYERV